MTAQEFSERVRENRDRLWRISYSILRNGADCDDALQEALLRAWKQRTSLRNEEYFVTWLTRILINECKRMLKRPRLQPLPEVFPQPPVSDNAELRDAILALPLNQRIPLVLHYIEGYPVKHIAAMLRLPETTVNWRLHSARKAIRDEWN